MELMLKTEEIITKVEEHSAEVEISESTLDEIVLRLKNKAMNDPQPLIQPVAISQDELKTREDNFDYNRDVILLSDYDKLSDDEFIRVAYRMILEREADAGGFDYYYDKLHSGRYSRAMILWSLKRSDEGKAGSKPLVGISKPLFMSLIRRVPVLGALLNLCFNIANLNQLYKTVHSLALTHEDIQVDLKKRIHSASYKNK